MNFVAVRKSGWFDETMYPRASRLAGSRMYSAKYLDGAAPPNGLIAPPAPPCVPATCVATVTRDACVERVELGRRERPRVTVAALDGVLPHAPGVEQEVLASL